MANACASAGMGLDATTINTATIVTNVDSVAAMTATNALTKTTAHTLVATAFSDLLTATHQLDPI